MQKKLLINSTSIYDKNSPESGHGGNILQIIKTVYDKPLTNIILSDEKLKAFPQRCPFLPPLFNIVLEILATAIREENEIEEIQIGKEEVKLSLVADDMTVYTENLKDAIGKLLELISEFSEVSGYKINIQKSFTFLCVNNEISERETKEIIPFTIIQKKKILRNKPTYKQKISVI